MSSLQQALQQSQEQNAQGNEKAQSALQQAMQASQNADQAAGGNEDTTTHSTAGSTATPIVYNPMDLQRRVERFGEEERERRKRNSDSIVLKAMAKSPNSYAVAEEKYGKTAKFPVKDSIAEVAVGIEKGDTYPILFPQNMRYTVDGYQVQLMKEDGTLGDPQVMSKTDLGKWIRENALMRIGTEERGVRIKERSTLTTSAYLVSHWGFNLKHGSSDVIESFEPDGDATKARSLNLDTGGVKFKDANNADVKIQASVQLPSYKRKSIYEQELGPLTIKNVGPIKTKHEMDAALLSLAKIAVAEEKLQAMQSN